MASKTGNSKRPYRGSKRVNNKAKNDSLRAKGQHPKQLRETADNVRHFDNVIYAEQFNIPMVKGFRKAVMKHKKEN